MAPPLGIGNQQRQDVGALRDPSPVVDRPVTKPIAAATISSAVQTEADSNVSLPLVPLQAPASSVQRDDRAQPVALEADLPASSLPAVDPYWRQVKTKKKKAPIAKTAFFKLPHPSEEGQLLKLKDTLPEKVPLVPSAKKPQGSSKQTSKKEETRPSSTVDSAELPTFLVPHSSCDC
ncbi:hypothetical protein ACJRO7_022303 [Eucalyptus globulus]|uniref:Uncharacterized protein n=1 Tax=Eucalyptus globulus TaxID=34317 RepID=A0ABD3KP66_EUCGL